MPLSDMKVRNMRPGEKPFKTADAEGLYLLTNPNGAKLWRMDYRFLNTRKTLAFGSYPGVTLLEARRLRDDAKRSLATGVDPGRAKKIAKIEKRASGQTFRDVADRWFAINSPRLVSGYSMRLKNRLVDDVYPSLGSTLIADIRPQEVLATLRKIEARGAIETARRIYQMVGNIFKFAVAEALIPSDPTRDIGAALAPANPVKRRASIKAVELPALMKLLDSDEGDAVTVSALRFVIHTFVRTNELRMAEWPEFENLGSSEALWRIPAEKMKMRKEHIVPLTTQAAAIVKDRQRMAGDSRWVFRSPMATRDQPISNNAMLGWLYRHGHFGKTTVHGFRSTASTVLNEQQFNRDWIEAQLAHVDDSVRGVYNSAIYLPQRREMMRWWSDFVEPIDEFEGLLG